MTQRQQAIFGQMKHSIEYLIGTNPTIVTFEKYIKKDNGFGTMVIDRNSEPAIISEQVKISHNVSGAQKATGTPVGLGEPYYNYILFRPCSQLEENTVVTDTCTGKKYRIHDIDEVKYAGVTYGKRAIIEDVE